MSHYFNTDPAMLNAYRQSTDRGVSSAGVRMTRYCSKCKKAFEPFGMKQVAGTGTSRHNPSRFYCKDCHP